jgi:hypothetical protein
MPRDRVIARRWPTMSLNHRRERKSLLNRVGANGSGVAVLERSKIELVYRAIKPRGSTASDMLSAAAHRLRRFALIGAITV